MMSEASRLTAGRALVLLGSLLLAGAAAAQDEAAQSPLAPAFGATIVSTHPDGRKARLWLHPDGTYAAESRAGKRSGGVWKLKGDKLCFRQRRPIWIPFTYCKAVQPEAVGQPWRDVAVNGDKVTNEIVPGGEPQAGAPQR
jgi:hypothetical protein